MRRLALPALMLLSTVALVGCYEDVTPVQYEPGVYKGTTDPLLEKLQGDELQAELEQRFQIAAQDR